MAAFAVLEPILAILIVGFVISQCFIPEITGHPWFPIFHHLSKIRTEIAGAKEDVLAQDLITQLNTLKQQLKEEKHEPSTETLP